MAGVEAGGRLEADARVVSSLRASCSSSKASSDGSCDTVRSESPRACRSCCISRPVRELLSTYSCLRFTSWLSCSLSNWICSNQCIVWTLFLLLVFCCEFCQGQLYKKFLGLQQPITYKTVDINQLSVILHERTDSIFSQKTIFTVFVQNHPKNNWNYSVKTF